MERPPFRCLFYQKEPGEFASWVQSGSLTDEEPFEFVWLNSPDELIDALDKARAGLVVIDLADAGDFAESLLSKATTCGCLTAVIAQDCQPSTILHWLRLGAWDCLPADSSTALIGLLWRARSGIDEGIVAGPPRPELLAAVAHSQEAVFIMEADGAIIYVNRAFEIKTGFRAGEITGRHLEILDSGYESNQFWSNVWSTLFHGQAWKGAMKARCSDGALLNWELALVPVESSPSSGVHYIGLARDLTIEEDLRNQLQQSQRMEALGQMASGIAHDFNNLLTTIIGLGYLLREDLPKESEWRSDLDEMVHAAERGAQLTRQLLAYSSKQRTEPQLVDLNALVLSLQKLVNRLIGENIELYSIHNITEATTLADPGQVEQTLMNVVMNARDAMPDGGMLRVSLEKRDVDAQEAAPLSINDGTYIVIAISDTGMGIPEDLRAKIFDPFFTTKEQGRGTGLGLATTWTIMRKVGGAVRIESEVGAGSTFYLYFPYVPGVQATDDGRSETSATGTETILLAEDEETVRDLACRVLRRLGYYVLEAFDGQNALEVAAGQKREIDLLITDVTMPRLNGRQLAQRLKSRRPKLPVLFICGYASETPITAGDENTDLLQKPFTPTEFAGKVREMLDFAK